VVEHTPEDEPLELPSRLERLLTQAELPLEAEAFYLGRQELYHRYAEVHLGNRREAEDLVHEVFAEIMADWPALLCEQHLEQAAFSVLRRVVRRRLDAEGRLPHYIVSGPVAQLLRAARSQLAIIPSDCGLYPAIAGLPPRQCDVIVLRHVMGYPTRTVAAFLGLDERTVDYHHRKAKERLRVALHLPPRAPSHAEEGPR
jgi:RNA polymerase sigma-70 factor (ECF subfamily)